MIYLALFCVCLLLCVVFGYSILYALLAGLLLFSIHGKSRGFSWAALLRMILSGILSVKNMLITFLLIGILTALWRASGTIVTIVSYASSFIRPSLFLPAVFLLNCGVSILTGTALGTAATMGVICSMMARATGVHPLWIGGAVLSGAFFGDRCSPVSTSALLVAELTHTEIFSNIRNMLRTSRYPFAISVAVYAFVGMLAKPSAPMSGINALFDSEFTVHWVVLLPALVILLLSAFKVNVRRTMSASILVAVPICLFLQRMAPATLLKTAVMGYSTAHTEAAAILNGGGVTSMLNVTAMVCLSSSYAGIFQKTGILDEIKRHVMALSQRTTPFTATLCTATITAIIACNQTLTIMLTHQLCGDIYQDGSAMAIDLEDTAVVVAPLVPWSIASAVPLGSVGAPAWSILAACFLYLLPLWRLLAQRRQRGEAVGLPG